LIIIGILVWCGLRKQNTHPRKTKKHTIKVNGTTPATNTPATNTPPTNTPPTNTPPTNTPANKIVQAAYSWPSNAAPMYLSSRAHPPQYYPHPMPAPTRIIYRV
jgi:hypothetical protein